MLDLAKYKAAIVRIIEYIVAKLNADAEGYKQQIAKISAESAALSLNKQRLSTC
jgi:hypothetical protein